MTIVFAVASTSHHNHHNQHHRRRRRYDHHNNIAIRGHSIMGSCGEKQMWLFSVCFLCIMLFAILGLVLFRNLSFLNTLRLYSGFVFFSCDNFVSFPVSSLSPNAAIAFIQTVVCSRIDYCMPSKFSPKAHRATWARAAFTAGLFVFKLIFDRSISKFDHIWHAICRAWHARLAAYIVFLGTLNFPGHFPWIFSRALISYSLQYVGCDNCYESNFYYFKHRTTVIGSNLHLNKERRPIS